MGRASLKSSDPIRLPHDGPLYHHGLLRLAKGQETTSTAITIGNQDDTTTMINNNDADDNDDAVTRLALKLLHYSNDDNDNDDNDENYDDNISGPYTKIRQLVVTLQTAPTIKKQLQTLQTFRAHNSNELAKQQQPQQQEEHSQHEQPQQEEQFVLYRQALYRILLEWFLSYQTPLPLRRACQANLEALDNSNDDDDDDDLKSTAKTYQQIRRNVLEQFWRPIQPTIVWQQPLHTLHEALNYHPTQNILLLVVDDNTNISSSLPTSRTDQVLQWLHDYAKIYLEPILSSTISCTKKTTTDTTVPPNVMVHVDQTVSDGMQRAIQWANILKTVLSNAPSLTIKTTVGDTATTTTDTATTSKDTTKQKTTVFDSAIFDFFRYFIWNLLTSPLTPTDALSKLGMVYSRVVLLQKPPLLSGPSSNHNTNNDRTCISIYIESLAPTTTTNQLQSQQEHPPTTTPLVAIAMVQGMAATVPIDVMLNEAHILLEYFQLQSLQADPGVRLAALKGIHTLTSRCLTRALQQKETVYCNYKHIQDETHVMQNLTQEILEIVLQAWESPPNRRLGNAIPSLFEKLVSLMLELDQDQFKDQNDDPDMHQQAGAFQALVKRLLAQPSNRKGRYKALETLLPIVGSRSMIALGEECNLMESLLEGIGDRNSHSAGTIADLWQKILTDLLHDMLTSEVLESNNDDKNNVASATVTPPATDKNKKKEEVPPTEIVEMVLPKWCHAWIPSLAAALLSSTPSRRKHVAQFCLPRISAMVGGRKKQDESSIAFSALIVAIQQAGAGSYGTVGSQALGGVRDCVVWATLEVIRNSNLEKTINKSIHSTRLLQTVVTQMPLETLQAALKHFLSTIRLVAFQTIKSLVLAYSLHKSDGERNKFENVDQEARLWQEAFPYAIKSEGLEYRASLLECLTIFIDRISSEESAAIVGPSNEHDAVPLPRLYSFVVEFLIFDVAILQAAYPNSVSEKESFAIDLIDSIIAFASRDQAFVTKNVAVYGRRRSASEIRTATDILKALLSREAIATMISLFSSIWDGTRSSSYRLLSRLIVVGHTNKIELADDYTSKGSRQGMLARGVYLASSPRQREADTGARILSFLYFSVYSANERSAYLNKLVDLVRGRLKNMRAMLANLLTGENDSNESVDGTMLPLAHGLIHSLRLITDHIEMESRQQNDGRSEVRGSHATLEKMAEIFCQAIQVSLAVVADVKDGEALDGMDEDLLADGDRQSNTPLNVNTGAIGANGTFSSIQTSEKDEQDQRIAIQRVVMGSWLLTRETCAALSALLTSTVFHAPESVFDRAGMLLISTLVSLKHAGAAFAAHRALQQISLACFKSRKRHRNLPVAWANRLLAEISEAERVRDSTLRRSTGYALGFLALMRSEVSSKADSRSLCTLILTKILRFSLPPKDALHHFFAKLDLSESFLHSIFPHLSDVDEQEELYKIRSRVHALNILRLIILDAPLANEVGPIIGNAIVSAVTGYNDKTWAVRNSSTMVFAAAMTRTVDADKNASVKDTTGNNAITIGELFRSYPSLAPFLNAVLASADALSHPDNKATSTPPTFPILLLLSRIQPVSNSRPESSKVSESFIGGVCKCLLDKSYFLRRAASLALANLCSGVDSQYACSLPSILNGCHRLLFHSIKMEAWNAVHGALLAMNTLVSAFLEAGTLLRKSGLINYFFKVVNQGIQWNLWPPICLSEALSILTRISAPVDSEIVWSHQISTYCEKAILLLEKSTEMTDGSSELAATAARAWCHRLVPKIWDLKSEKSKESLSKMSILLGSDLIDVRLHACKVFKKTIYFNIDRLLDCAPADECKMRLIAVSFNIAAAIQQELARATQEDIHHPTLRRLSRCLLECVNAWQLLSQKPTQLPKELSEKLVAVIKGLVDQDNCLGKENGFPRETPLSGNALELLSFVIAGHPQLLSGGNVDVSIETSVHNFAMDVCRLSNPHLPWRLRHSAAVAVEKSNLLSWNGVNESIKISRQALLEEVLRILQDQDPDVRCAASRAVQALNSNSFENSLPSVSQLVLEQAFRLAYAVTCANDCPAEEMQGCVGRLLEGVLGRCQGANSKLIMLQEELKNTYSPVELELLLNVGTQRKIFEDEVANPYEEIALANQLAVRNVLQFNASSLDGKAATLVSTLMAKCEALLSFLKANFEESRTEDLLHDVTRSPTAFMELHSLLVVTAAIIYLDGSKDSNIRNVANEILTIPASNRKLHPSVQAALLALGGAQTGDQTTRSSILGCLFLLPNSCYISSMEAAIA